MASGIRPSFGGRSFNKSQDQKDQSIPLPRDDRRSFGGPVSQPPSPSSTARPVDLSAADASDLRLRSRENSSRTPAKGVLDLSKISDMDAFQSMTSDTVSPTSGSFRDGLNTARPHHGRATPCSPTSGEVGFHGRHKAKVSHALSSTGNSVADELEKPEDDSPTSRPPSRQGAASPRPGSSMGRTQRRLTLPASPRPATSATSRRKSFSVHDADSCSPPRKSGSISPKKFSSANDADIDSRSVASTGIQRAPRSVTDGSPVQRTLTGGRPPSSQSTSSRPQVQKASTFSEISDGLDQFCPSPKREGGGRARRLSLIPAGQLQRQLSFADESLDELSANIFEEDPQLDWLEDLWNRVLVGTPPADSRGLSTRSMDYWIEIFNRWQALGSWKPGSAPKIIDAYELQELLSVPMPKTLAWVKLFDPAAYAQHECTRSAMDLKKVKISVPAFLSSGIFLSTTISKRQKIRFLLGIFNENDSQTLEPAEFMQMISSFFYGIAGAFALLDNPCIAPKPSARQQLGKCLFERVLNSACCRLPSCEAKKIKANDAAPLWLIEEWFLSESGDPLSAPFKMLLERFSIRGLDDDPDIFEDEEKSFKMSHTGSVESPLETAAALDSSFLRRDEIGMVRKVFQESERQRDFALSHADLERALGESIPPDLWCRVVRGLDEMERLRGTGQKPSLSLFLRKICQNAKPKHLRMFQIWLKELDLTEELRGRSSSFRRMQLYVESYFARPVLPARIRQELLEEYDNLAYSTREARVMQDALRKRFFDGGSRVTKEDYVAAMCPTEFRHKESSPAVSQVVGQLLSMQVATVEQALLQKEALFAKRGEAAAGTRKNFIKPAVPDRHWALWNEAFDVLSQSGDDRGEGRVSLSQLVRRNDLCPAICEFMCSIITGRAEGNEPGFSRESFLQKLLELSPWRVKGRVLSQGTFCTV